MQKIINKSVIILICIALCALENTSTADINALLLTVGISAVTQSITDKKIRMLILTAGSALSLFFPQMLYCLPLLFYDMTEERKRFISVLFIPSFFYIPDITPIHVLLIVTGCIVSSMMCGYINIIDESIKNFCQLRDKEKEKNIELNMKNKQLIENQDAEIHLATLQERNRIAREIHDNVGHMLTRSLLQVGALCIVSKDESQKEMLESLRQTLDTAMTSIRSSVHDLHDDSIDLKTAIEECLKPIQDKYDVSVEFDISSSTPKKIKFCIIGIVKESISNILKHSNGNAVKVVLREHPAFYQVAVSDNGNCSEINHTGIGLSSMKERAASVEGRISFTPSENGFRVFLSVPKTNNH